MDRAKRFWLIAGPNGVGKTTCRAADLWRIYEASGPRPCLAAEGHRSLLAYVDADCLAVANETVRNFVENLDRRSS